MSARANETTGLISGKSAPKKTLSIELPRSNSKRQSQKAPYVIQTDKQYGAAPTDEIIDAIENEATEIEIPFQFSNVIN